MNERKSQTKRHILRNLRLEEISGVDIGANPGAHVLFFKRNQPEEPSDMELKELTKRLEDLEKSGKASADEIAKLKSERDALADQIAKAKADEELKKANEKDDVQKAIAPVQKALDEANAEIKKLREKNELAEFEKSFDKDLPNFGGSADEKSALLKSLKAMPEETRKTVMANLKKADEIKGQYFIEKGTAHRGPDDPVTKLDGLAKKRSAEKGEVYEVAYAKVLETAEGQQLYAASQKQ